MHAAEAGSPQLSSEECPLRGVARSLRRRRRTAALFFHKGVRAANGPPGLATIVQEPPATTPAAAAPPIAAPVAAVAVGRQRQRGPCCQAPGHAAANSVRVAV